MTLPNARIFHLLCASKDINGDIGIRHGSDEACCSWLADQHEYVGYKGAPAAQF